MEELKNVSACSAEIGGRLHLRSNVLDGIRRQNLSSTQAMEKVIMEWLRKNYDTSRYGPPTWKVLVQAVFNPAGGNNRAEAERIALRHKIG